MAVEMPHTHPCATAFFSFLFSSRQVPLPSTMQNQPSKPDSSSSATSMNASQNPAPGPSRQLGSLHVEIRSVVSLTILHGQKIYFSGPLIRRIERQPDGHKPAKDDGWTEVWAQLGGTTLSIWDMAEIQEASRQGKEVPPTYVNVTDAVRIAFSPSLPPQFASSLVCPSSRFCHYIHPSTSVPTTVYKRLHSQHRWFQSPPLLLSINIRTHFMGFRPQAISMGKIAFGGNIHCSSDQDDP